MCIQENCEDTKGLIISVSRRRTQNTVDKRKTGEKDKQ